jgi:hypothetical protein
LSWRNVFLSKNKLQFRSYLSDLKFQNVGFQMSELLLHSTYLNNIYFCIYAHLDEIYRAELK